MERIVEYTLKAKEDIEFFKKSGQHKTLKKIRQLIESILQNPFDGMGKPEPLHSLSGTWFDYNCRVLWNADNADFYD